MTGFGRSLGLLTAGLLGAGCIHHAPTEVRYDPVDVRSRTDLLGLAARHYGFERGTPPAFGVPTHLAFAWVRDTRAFPQRYGTDRGILSGPERQALAGALQARLSSPPFTPVTRIPPPAVAGGPAPLAVPGMPVSSATRRAVRTAGRLGAEVVIVVQTRTEEERRRNVVWPVSLVDPSARVVPGHDLTVHARAEACAIYVKRAWLLQCAEASAESMQPWVNPLQEDAMFAVLRQRALRAVLHSLADEVVAGLLPLTDPPAPVPDAAETATSPLPGGGETAATPIEPDGTKTAANSPVPDGGEAVKKPPTPDVARP